METIKNIFSVAPDSYIPLKHISTINLIFWLALSIFILENSVMLLFYGLQGFTTFFPIGLITPITNIINSLFITISFPFKFIELIKPFSPLLYGIFYVVLCIYAMIVGGLNSVIKHFTGKTLDI
mgnify:FL=1